MNETIFQALAEAARVDEPVALGIISGAKGSSPQKVGAKALFYTDGRIAATLGGGCLEAEVQQRALQSLRTGKPTTFDLLLDHDFGWDDGLICGGKVEGLIVPNAQRAGEAFWNELARREKSAAWGVKKDFSIASADFTVQSSAAEEQQSLPPVVSAEDWLYQETVSPRCALWIAGAGHIARAVAPIAWQLDFEVSVFDDRPVLASHQFFPPEIHLQADVWEKLLQLTPPNRPSFGLIVTRGHRHDALVLGNWIHKPFLFLGMIGSARKARIIFEQFTQDRIATAEQLHRVACPVGIKIRSRTVPEIAVSILAQFIDKRAELAYRADG